MCGFDRIRRGKFLEESQLEELRLRREWASSRMGRTLVGMRSQEKLYKVEVTGWWIGSGDYVICPLRVVLCPNTRDLL